jgi:hypothetical protein
MEPVPVPDELERIEELPLEERAEPLEELERRLRASLDDGEA